MTLLQPCEAFTNEYSSWLSHTVVLFRKASHATSHLLKPVHLGTELKKKDLKNTKNMRHLNIDKYLLVNPYN